jgi:amino acid adenylation domain-containing protein
MATGPTKPIDVLGAETKRLLAEWNRTELEIDSWKPIHQLFDRQAARTPDKTAVVCRERSLTYKELEQGAGRLAGDLQSLGVGPESVVAVCLERSLEMIVAMWGVLKAGGAYLPLDPSFPGSRIDFMLRDSGARVVLTQPELRARFQDSTAAVKCVDILSDGAESRESARYEARAHADNLAYLIYTSGSTGTPKGVMVEHRNVVNFFCGIDRAIGSKPGVWLAVTSISFDISVLELLWTLTRGFTVIVQAEEDKLASSGPYSVAEQIERFGVTHLQCTPTFARMLIRSPRNVNSMKSLQKLLVGGEALPVALANQLADHLPAEIHNMYGPTETTIWSTSYRLAEHARSIPIGKPLANTRVYVLDEMLRRVPIGEVGELYIAGSGVARGYLNQPELTAERFAPDPFRGNPDERMYRTGDLARFRSDGDLEFLGRTDHQIKIRGYRVELGEIETALSKHHAVQEVVVTPREDTAGNPILVAYVVTRPELTPAPAELREFVRTELPEYMVPSLVVFLDRLPTTPNGKIDRKALPTPTLAAAAGASAARTSGNELENAIARIWQDALGVDFVDLNQNLFDLGATSLTVAEVATTIRDVLKRDVRVTQLFEYSTISSFAAYLSAHAVEGSSGEGGQSRGEARRAALMQRSRAGTSPRWTPD